MSGIELMESSSGDINDSTEDIPGRKKSKLKFLKTRFFGRNKRAGGEVNTKLSQSASDITAGKQLGSDEDLVCSQGMMGSRALSHDSIFLSDEVLTDADEPVRVLSQENVHSKIKALQMKLQQQKLHLGPPPLVLPSRRQEDLGSCSEKGGLPHSPAEISAGDITTPGTLSKTMSPPCSHPLSPILKPSTTKSVPSNPRLSILESPLDFSSPAQFTACLDTSAARHRMSVKPRNQRASSKKRLIAPQLETLNNINRPESVKDEEQEFSVKDDVTLGEQGGTNIPIKVFKSPQQELMTSEAAPKSSGLTVSQQDNVLCGRFSSVPSQVLRVKPYRQGDVMSERPHSSFIQSELREKGGGSGDSETQSKSHDKRNTTNKAGTTDINSREVSSDPITAGFCSVVTLRSSSVSQQVKDETENSRGIKRAAPGSGSFHFSITTSKNQEGERPRSSSFVEVLEQARKKTAGRAEDTIQPRGGAITVGRLRQEPKGSVLPWNKQDSEKKVESVTPSTGVTTDMGPSEVGEVESNREAVEEAVEAKEEVQEEEGKTVFGFKLRPTSQSMRFWSDVPSKPHGKPPLSGEQCDRQNTQKISDHANETSKKSPTNTSCIPATSVDVRLTGKHNSHATISPCTLPTEVQTTTSNTKEVEPVLAASQEAQSAPQTPSPEVSWMSLAIEKTKSIHQLFTSRFPRDFSDGQATARPQAQPTNPAETSNQAQTPSVKLQQCIPPLQAANLSSLKVEEVQSQSQTFKSSLMATTVQQRTSSVCPSSSNTSKEPELSKQINKLQMHISTTQPVSNSVSQPAIQTNPWTTQSPLRSFPQRDTTSQLGQIHQSLTQSYLSSDRQQYPRSSQGPLPANQLKSVTSPPISTTSSAAAPSPVSATGRAAAQDKDSPSPLGKRPVWAGSVSEKAAFLEKRAEWTTGTKGVELKKIDAQISGESPALVQKSQSKFIKPEGRPGIKLAESSPTKIPDRPLEEKWPRKNMGSSPSSLSPPMPSALQTMSDSDQPSWKELAKRKSRAWSDKTMD